MQLSLLDLEPIAPSPSPVKSTVDVNSLQKGDWIRGRSIHGQQHEGAFRCLSASGMVLIGLGDRPDALLDPKTLELALKPFEPQSLCFLPYLTEQAVSNPPLEQGVELSVGDLVVDLRMPCLNRGQGTVKAFVPSGEDALDFWVLVEWKDTCERVMFSQIERKALSSSALEWHKTGLRYYQKLQVKFVCGNGPSRRNPVDRYLKEPICPEQLRAMRSHMVSHLQTLCNEVKEKITQLEQDGG